MVLKKKYQTSVVTGCTSNAKHVWARGFWIGVLFATTDIYDRTIR